MGATTNIFAQFKNKHIVVIGDVMIDHYIIGKVERISPEAPVPIVHAQTFDNRLGGASNVALNIVALGAQASILSVIGNDANGSIMKKLFTKQKINHSHLVLDKNRITTLKARIIGNNHQLLRYDVEQTDAINKDAETNIVEGFKKILLSKKIDAVIFEDYNKGVLTPAVIKNLISICIKNKIPTLVDPKKNNFFEYKNVSLFKPNLKEINESLQIAVTPDIASLEQACKELQKNMPHTTTLVTLADKGMYYKTAKSQNIVPTSIRQVADVSGAGDTVIAIAALGLAANLDLDTIAQLANLAGGIVCEKPGVVSIDLAQLKLEWNQLHNN